jgi:hypothetical protein
MSTAVDTANRDYAVVIGIEKYRHGGLKPLGGARTDAEEFVTWLKCQYANARFDPKNRDGRIITCISPDKADWSAVKGAFDELMDKAPNGGRRLYIFVSGHGFGQTVHDASVYCSDYRDLTDPACCSITETANWLKFCGRFQEVIVFIDCCRHYNTSLQARGIFRDGEQIGSPAAHFYLMSCDLGEASEQWKIAGEDSGIFSFQLIRALNGKVKSAVDSQGKVTAYSLVRHVRRKVPPTMHPHFDPPDDKVSRTLVFAEGFEAKPDVFYIKLLKPELGFGLFRSQYTGDPAKPFLPLAWKWEKGRDGRLKVYWGDEETVMVTVPEKPDFNRRTDDWRQEMVWLGRTEIEI